MKTYTLHVSGTHCPACKILLEDTLNEQIGIENTYVDLRKKTVSLETSLDNSIDEITDMLNEKIKHNGYSLSIERVSKEKDGKTIWLALPLGIGFLILFFLLQKSGILNFGIGGQITPASSFTLGLIASVSSCLAVVGGLILSLSAKISQDGVDDKKNFILFHVGRIGGFTLLGGILGLLGHAIGINPLFSSMLGIIAAVVMILLGGNLVGIFAQAKITLPVGIFQFFRKIEHKTLTPVIVGVSTFFLPCGFTQSMQISALSSGSFLSGGLIMFAFSLGTFPMLALLSFGSSGFAHSRFAPLFFKSAGIVVIGLGIFALLAGLAGLGIINPIINI